MEIKRDMKKKIYKISIGDELGSHIEIYPRFHLIIKTKEKSDSSTFKGKIYDLSFYGWKSLFEPYLKIKTINGLYSENEDYLLYNPIRRLLGIDRK